MIEEKENYLNKLLQEEAGVRILSEKLSLVLEDKELYKYGVLTKIVDRLIDGGYSDCIISNFSKLLKQAIEDEILYIVYKVSTLQNGKKILADNINLVYSKLDGEDIPQIIDLLEDLDREIIIKRNDYAYYLYNNGFIGETSLGSIIKSDASIFIQEIVKEVSDGKELSKIASGTYSDVIKTNGYVIKIGETRDNFEIPYHPNILQPLLRERIVDEDGNNVLVVEVQNLVDTKNVDNKKIKILEEKLRQSKIKCRDALGDNVGILIKPNKRLLFNGVGGIIDDDDIQEETLDVGEVVILDADMIEKE